MSYKVTDNTRQVENKFSQKANIFLRITEDAIVSLAEPDTPKKTGRLRRDVLKQVLGLKGKIQWQKGYAAIQETKRFRNYTTPGTGPHFAEGAIRGIVKQTASLAKKAGLI